LTRIYVQKTGRVAFMEAPVSFLAKLREYSKKPLMEVLQDLEGCTEDQYRDLPRPMYPFSNMADSVKPTEVGTADSRERIAAGCQQQEAACLVASAPPQGFLAPFIFRSGFQQWTDSTSVRTDLSPLFGGRERERIRFVPVTANQKKLDTKLPILKCTTLSCDIYSNAPLIACPSCPKGTMAINCSFYSKDLEELEDQSEPVYLEENLVYAFPFLARKTDAAKGLDLSSDDVAKYRRVEKQAICEGRISISQPIFRCAGCDIVWSGRQVCPRCRARGRSLTFVSADSANPSKRVYWPLGSIRTEPAAEKQAEGGSEDESSVSTEPAAEKDAEEDGPEDDGSASCLVTDALEIHKGISAVRMLELLKAQGIFCIDDLVSLTVETGTKEVLHQALFMGTLHQESQPFSYASNVTEDLQAGGCARAAAPLTVPWLVTQLHDEHS